MAHAMGSTAKAMAATNQQLKVEDIMKTMQGFEQESAKMDMAGEMSECVREGGRVGGRERERGRVGGREGELQPS